jgi:hypothetical protein
MYAVKVIIEGLTNKSANLHLKCYWHRSVLLLHIKKRFSNGVNNPK